MTPVKPLFWIGSSKKDLKSLPEDVQDVFGYASYLAQVVKKHVDAKPLHGFESAGVLEVVEDWKGATYRAIYTVRFPTARCLSCMSSRRNRRKVSGLPSMILI